VDSYISNQFKLFRELSENKKQMDRQFKETVKLVRANDKSVENLNKISMNQKEIVRLEEERNKKIEENKKTQSISQGVAGNLANRGKKGVKSLIENKLNESAGGRFLLLLKEVYDEEKAAKAKQIEEEAELAKVKQEDFIAAHDQTIELVEKLKEFKSSGDEEGTKAVESSLERLHDKHGGKVGKVYGSEEEKRELIDSKQSTQLEKLHNEAPADMDPYELLVKEREIKEGNQSKGIMDDGFYGSGETKKERVFEQVHKDMSGAAGFGFAGAGLDTDSPTPPTPTAKVKNDYKQKEEEKLEKKDNKTLHKSLIGMAKDTKIWQMWDKAIRIKQMALSAVSALRGGFGGKLGKLGGLTKGLGGKLGGITKGIGSKLGGKSLLKLGGKGVGKGLLKLGGKSLLKKIPIIGALAGLGFGASRALKGDFSGAAMEVGSGAASLFPGLGTAGSVAIDAALAAKDGMSDGGDSTELMNGSPDVANMLSSSRESADNLSTTKQASAIAGAINPVVAGAARSPNIINNNSTSQSTNIAGGLSSKTSAKDSYIW